MIADILTLFRSSGGETDSRTQLSTEDERLALAALLVRAARSDGDYDIREKSIIDRILRERFAMPDVDSVRVRREAEVLEAKAPDTVRFTRAVKRNVAHENREAIVEALWRVVLADDRRDAEEDGFLRLVVHLLGVSDRDSGFARRRAQKALFGRNGVA
ncbi:MAG: TerB family tellurite resistance protein [Paracoccaceae bacterium]|nr:TerB family tellurite resistance protein [Paracoccaceae bacterium]